MITTGQILNDTYKITERLGSGGGGIVFKAYHLRLEKYVAVKLIKDEVKGAVNERAEADILKRLKHEGLPQVYDFVTDGDDVYTVMEYIDGKTLQEEIAERGRIPYKQALEWAKELCSAAAYLHSRKPPIIHSDIKPQNIMITGEGKLCLIDFNISSVFGGGVYTVGSSDGYSPPEQYAAKREMEKALAKAADNDRTEIIDSDPTEILGEVSVSDDMTELISQTSDRHEVSAGMIDERSDVYSIGAVMYSMVTGVKPKNSLVGASPITKLDENIPEAYAYIVSKAMQSDKKDRFSSAAQMLDALGKINRLDRRYKHMTVRHNLAYAFCLVLLAASAASAAYGWQLMGTEKNNRFESYTAQLEKMAQSGDFSGFDGVYQAAEKEFSDSPELCYYNFLRIYDSGAKDDAAAYADEYLESASSQLPDDMRSNYCYMRADICFGDENYTEAADLYSSAAKYNPENPDIYRDYAISLARSGDTVSAEKILETAISLGLEEDGIYMVSGEISFMNGKYDEAIDQLLSGIALTENDTLKRNAYLICSRAYQQDKNEESIQADISLLEKAVIDVPKELSMQIREYLIQAYMDMGELSGNTEYYAKAITMLNEMRQLGWRDYRTEMNLAVLLDRIGDTYQCRDILLEMAADPEYELNYFTIYLRLAYCEADIQSKKDISERDYSTFDEYYRSAEKAYEAYTENGGSDPEMDRLRELRDQMAEMGWVK